MPKTLCPSCVRARIAETRAQGMPPGKKKTKFLKKARDLHQKCRAAACPCRHGVQEYTS